MRVGHGYDVHKLVSDRLLILAGVRIPHETGLLGHSDADVLAHAVIDALLGAAALGDIGMHFPDNEPQFKDADSLVLLKYVVNLLECEGYQIGNIDCTILAQEPKLRPYIAYMTENIASTCNVPIRNINIKATTEEGLGFTGKKHGIAVHCVALIKSE